MATDTQKQWTDPTSGTVVDVTAGETAVLNFPVSNDEQKVVIFFAEVSALGDWTPDRSPSVPVVPFDRGTVTVSILPPAEAAAGDYPFKVKLIAGDDLVEPNGERNLTLRVSASLPKPAPLPPIIEEPAPATEGPEPTPAKPPGPRKQPEPRPDPEPVVVELEPEPKPAPEPAPTPQPAPPPPVPQPVPVAPPEPVRQPEPIVVNLQREPEPVEDEPPPLAVDATHVSVNPKEGTILYARPGETVLVRFDITNSQGGIRTYVIQEDRALPQDWISLVQDQVNITPGGTGEVSALLKPPITAEPANYPFTLSSGILGQPLTPCQLTLTVQAAPAVRLSTRQAGGSVGPLGRTVGFEVAVESAGNADTAYRISVKDPQAEKDAQGKPVGNDDLYETSSWRYVFDKEIDTLASPSANLQPPAESHRLRVVRKGVWWLGWRETHKLTVAARPVTDPLNGGKGGNAVTLTASRWRLFPLPGFVMVPLLLVILILLGSGAKDLTVTNALPGEGGRFYVVGKGGDMSVHLKWSAPFYALLKGAKVEEGTPKPIALGRQAAVDSVRVDDYGQARKVTYEVGSRITGGGDKVDVRFVPERTAGQLAISSEGVTLPEKASEAKLGAEEVKVTVREVTVVVPKDGVARLSFQNLTGRGGVNGATIVLWTIKQPQGFTIDDFLYKNGDNQPITTAATQMAKIRVSSEPPSGGEDTWELLTTDSNSQLLRIRLKVGQ